MTMCGAWISPTTWAWLESVSTAAASSARMLPSILPSTCRRPLNCTSPRICVPVAISDVVSVPVRASFLLLLNIGDLRCGQRVGPGEILFRAAHLAAGIGFHPDAVRRESLRQHQRALEL